MDPTLFDIDDETEPGAPYDVANPNSSEGEREATSVFRVAAIGTLLSRDREAAALVREEMSELGFTTAALSAPRTDVLGNPGPRLPHLVDLDGQILVRSSENLWEAMNDTFDELVSVEFLISVLGGRSARASTAAAAVLRRLFREAWSPTALRGFMDRNVISDPFRPLGADGHSPHHDRAWLTRARDYLDRAGFGSTTESQEEWTAIYRYGLSLGSHTPQSVEPLLGLGLVVGLRLGIAQASYDPIARSLAWAAFLPSGAARSTPRLPAVPVSQPTPRADAACTIVHGTRGWRGEWWCPGGDFHTYVLQDLRPSLYAKGAPFSWDGSLRNSSRELAGGRLRNWALSEASGSLATVFAHSYGGDVAAHALFVGQPIAELVLLSAPVTPLLSQAACLAQRIVDIRLRFDPVLGIIGARQRLAAGCDVTTVILRGWRLNHAATHSATVWRTEGLGARARL